MRAPASSVWRARLSSRRDAAAMPPLHDACLQRNLTGLQAALRAGYPVNAPNEAGVSPLMCAALVNCKEVTQELLDNKAFVGCVAGRTPR